MRQTALRRCPEHVLLISLPVPTTAASHIPGGVTLIMTVGTARMKQTAVSIPVEARHNVHILIATPKSSPLKCRLSVFAHTVQYVWMKKVKM